MISISKEEYDELQEFLKPRILGLWNHENNHNHLQNHTQIGFPINSIFKYKTENDELDFYIYNPLFLKIIQNYLPNATKNFPEKFGTGNAWMVVDALYQESQYPLGSIKDYYRVLCDTPCYIVFKYKDEFQEDILRIDLFRNIKSRDGITDFIGGLFHLLKHFSLNGINLSIGHDINEVFDIMHIIYLIAMAFKNRIGNGNSYEATQNIYKDDKHILKYYFYKEENNGIFFVKTCHLEEK